MPDPMTEYTVALREFDEAEASVLRIGRKYAEVGGQLVRDWRRVSIADLPAYPPEATMVVSAGDLPDGRSLHDRLMAVIGARSRAQAAFDRLPPETRKIVRQPPG